MNTEARNNRKRMLLIGGGLVALGVIAFVVFAVWFLQDDAPDEVAIDSAAAQVASGSDDTTVDPTAAATDPTTPPTDTTAGTDGDTGTTDGTTATTTGGAETTDPPANDGLSGAWTVDTSIGEFSYEDSTGTFVGFRVEEELSSIGSTTAVGRTPEVAGTLTIDGTTITEVTIEADMSAITTNDGRRDDRVQSALNTSENPTATFVLAEPITLDDAALAGEAVSIDALGDLTINGVTQSVTFPLQAQLVEDTVVVVGSLDVTFADYDVEVPSAPIVVSAEDHGPIELQLFFTR